MSDSSRHNRAIGIPGIPDRLTSESAIALPRNTQYHAIAAIGVDSEGCKHVLGLREGASENKVVTTALLEDLVERGLNPAAASVEPTRLLVFGPLPLCAAV